MKNQHGLNATTHEAQEVREKAKLLCCEHLHGQALDSDFALDTGSDEVRYSDA